MEKRNKKISFRKIFDDFEMRTIDSMVLDPMLD
jgi:hypothetical protein